MRNKGQEIVLKALIENPTKTFTAKDFMYGKYFIGYEASARMSEIARLYFEILEIGKDGRFRTLRLRQDNQSRINEIKKMLAN